jgi:hypothetical protein
MLPLPSVKGESLGASSFLWPNAKLSYPERAHKLWSDVNGKEKRS